MQFFAYISVTNLIVDVYIGELPVVVGHAHSCVLRIEIAVDIPRRFLFILGGVRTSQVVQVFVLFEAQQVAISAYIKTHHTKVLVP